MTGESQAHVSRPTLKVEGKEARPESKSLDDSSNDEKPTRERPSVRRVKTGGSELDQLRPQRGVNRSLSTAGSRRNMMNQRAMSTRDFGSGPRPGRGGLAMTRPGSAGRGGRGLAAANRSMSSRLLGAASDNVFARMASTRALFMDEPQEKPYLITYLGREIKAEEHFDDDWLEDVIDENTGMGNSSSQRSLGGSSKRRGLDSSSKRRSVNNGSYRKDSSDEGSSDSSEEEEEEEEEMEEMNEDTSANDCGAKRRARRVLSATPSSPKRSQSSEPGPKRPPAPLQRGVGRSRTFDGRQTSEVMPRRRKLKTRTAKRKELPVKESLTQQFQYFLDKTGGITPNVNNMYQDGLNFTVETGTRRLHTRYPRSRKRIEQFRKLKYRIEDIQDVLCEDDETFQRLKRVLSKKGAITNGILEQRLHIFLKKAKDRIAKALEEQKEKEGEDEEDENLDDPSPSDWLNMFALSVRKLTSDNDSHQHSSEASATKTGEGEPKLQRKTLPRMQAMQQKRMQAHKKASRSLMSSLDEAEDEKDESKDNENTDNLQGCAKRDKSPFGRKAKNDSLDRPWGGTFFDANGNDKNGTEAPVTKKKSTLDKPWGGQFIDANEIKPKELPVSGSPIKLDLDATDIVPKELPVTRSPIKLDLTTTFKESAPISRELPFTRPPLEVDVTPKAEEDVPVAKELPVTRPPMKLDLSGDIKFEPKCLDDERSSGQEPVKLDLSDAVDKEEVALEPRCLDGKVPIPPQRMKFEPQPSVEPKNYEPSTTQGRTKVDFSNGQKEELPVEPKCLDDELSASQRPMKLDLTQNFRGDLPIEQKCLDDELSASQRPMKLDLSQNFKDGMPVEPKCLDDGKKDDKQLKLDLDGSSGRLLHSPKRLDSSSGGQSMEDGSKVDSSSRNRRKHRPSRIRNHSIKSTSSGISRSSSTNGSLTPSRSRSRRTRSDEGDGQDHNDDENHKPTTPTRSRVRRTKSEEQDNHHRRHHKDEDQSQSATPSRRSRRPTKSDDQDHHHRHEDDKSRRRRSHRQHADGSDTPQSSKRNG